MIERFVLPISTLKRDRQVVIYVPDHYEESVERYPVLYINDGENAFFDETSFGGKSWGFLDYVTSSQMKVILVAIYCNQEGFKRMDEYGPWPIDEDLSFHETRQPGLTIGGEGDLYVRWIMDELKPWVDARYPTNPEDTAICGSSMGGVIASYATLAYPEVFKKCAALSTAFWFYENEFTQLIEQSDLSHVEAFYFDIGSDEGCGDDEANIWYRQTNAHILALLQDRIESLYFQYIGNACHNEWEWSKRVPVFMPILFGKKGD